MSHKGYLLILTVFLMLAVCVSAVSAEDNVTDVVSADESSSDDKLSEQNDADKLSSDNDYDKVVDHRHDMEVYNQVYTPFEVNPGETFVKDIGLTHIEIKNTNTEKSYHEITYTYRNGEKVIDDEWSCGLNLGAKNVNRDGLIVCHVLLHGSEIVKEREPVYKTVKVSKKVFSHYKKVKVSSYKFKEWNIVRYNIIKDIKHRIKIWDIECCSKIIWKIVDKVNYNDYAYKIKIVKTYKNKKYFSHQNNDWRYPVKVKVTLYKKKPVYKTVKVNKKECTGYKVLNVLHMY